MTTPDTAAVRTWARENGYQVADRGRLPADLTDAYLAANGGRRKAAPAKKAAVKKAAPAKRATSTRNIAAEQAAAPKAAAPKDPAPKAPAPKAEAPAPAPEKTPRPKPSLVNDDRRLVALGEEIKALTQRVEALEKAAGGSKSGSKAGTGKANPFRRRS